MSDNSLQTCLSVLEILTTIAQELFKQSVPVFFPLLDFSPGIARYSPLLETVKKLVVFFIARPDPIAPAVSVAQDNSSSAAKAAC